MTIQNYLGVDVNIDDDDDWMLALWGFKDPRRKVLSDYYATFKPKDNDHYKRIKGDASRGVSYHDAAIDRLGNCEHLVVVTSYMIYQLTKKQRWGLCRGINHLRQSFLKLSDTNQFTWLNQGISPSNMISGNLTFNSIFLSRITFKEHGPECKPIAQLHDDLAEGWSLVHDPAISNKWEEDLD